jgi:hypothetical protein
MTRISQRHKEEIIRRALARVPPAAGRIQAPAIASPTAPSAGYVQAEAASMKTAVDAIRAALVSAGITL